MANAITRLSPGTLAIGEQYGFDAGKLQLVKDWVAQGTTDEELALFLYTAHRYGLDPLAKQIYCIKRWNQALGREVATPQTGIDGYRLIADRTGCYAPGRAPTFEYDGEGKLYSATAYVQKYVRQSWHEVAATAHWSEYAQTKKNGEYTQMWATKPHIMLAKCAESLALRRAFPSELSGIYTDTEMGDPAPTPDQVVEGHYTVSVEPTQEPPSRPAPPAPDTTLLIGELRGIRKELHTLGVPLLEMTIGHMKEMSPTQLEQEITRARRALELEHGKLAAESTKAEAAGA